MALSQGNRERIAIDVYEDDVDLDARVIVPARRGNLSFVGPAILNLGTGFEEAEAPENRRVISGELRRADGRRVRNPKAAVGNPDLCYVIKPFALGPGGEPVEVPSLGDPLVAATAVLNAQGEYRLDLPHTFEIEVDEEEVTCTTDTLMFEVRQAIEDAPLLMASGVTKRLPLLAHVPLFTGSMAFDARSEWDWLDTAMVPAADHLYERAPDFTTFEWKATWFERQAVKLKRPADLLRTYTRAVAIYEGLTTDRDTPMGSRTILASPVLVTREVIYGLCRGGSGSTLRLIASRPRDVLVEMLQGAAAGGAVDRSFEAVETAEAAIDELVAALAEMRHLDLERTLEQVLVDNTPPEAIFADAALRALAVSTVVGTAWNFQDGWPALWSAFDEAAEDEEVWDEEWPEVATVKEGVLAGVVLHHAMGGQRSWIDAFFEGTPPATSHLNDLTSATVLDIATRLFDALGGDDADAWLAQARWAAARIESALDTWMALHRATASSPLQDGLMRVAARFERIRSLPLSRVESEGDHWLWFGWSPTTEQKTALARALRRQQRQVRLAPPGLATEVCAALEDITEDGLGSGREVLAFGSDFEAELAAWLTERWTEGDTKRFATEEEAETEATNVASRVLKRATAAVGRGQRFALRSAEQESPLVVGPATHTLTSSGVSWCACGACDSVFGPAAYLVDLLKFVKDVRESSTGLSALDALNAVEPTGSEPPDSEPRRPEIAEQVLSCDNANVELPAIDLVIELLEHRVVWTAHDLAMELPGSEPVPEPEDLPTSTTGPASLRRVEPEHTENRATADQVLAQAVYPRPLPLDLATVETRALLEREGLRRHTLMAAMQHVTLSEPPPADAVSAGDIARERLGWTPIEWALLVGQDVAGSSYDHLAAWYGMNPEVDAEWWLPLARIDRFLAATGLAQEDLDELLSCLTVNPALIIDIENESPPSCDLANHVLTKAFRLPMEASYAEGTLTFTVDEGHMFHEGGFVAVDDTATASLTLPTGDPVRRWISGTPEGDLSISGTDVGENAIVAVEVDAEGETTILTSPWKYFYRRLLRLLLVRRALRCSLLEADHVLRAVLPADELRAQTAWTDVSARRLASAMDLEEALGADWETVAAILGGWRLTGRWNREVVDPLTASARDPASIGCVFVSTSHARRFLNPEVYKADLTVRTQLLPGASWRELAGVEEEFETDVNEDVGLRAAVLAGVQLRERDWQALVALSSTPLEVSDTSLSLDLITHLLRARWLARASSLSVSAFGAIAQALDINDPFEEDLGGTGVIGELVLAYLRAVRDVRDVGTPIATWRYLVEDVAPGGTAPVTPAWTAGILREVREGARALITQLEADVATLTTDPYWIAPGLFSPTELPVARLLTVLDRDTVGPLGPTVTTRRLVAWLSDGGLDWTGPVPDALPGDTTPVHEHVAYILQRWFDADRTLVTDAGDRDVEGFVETLEEAVPTERASLLRALAQRRAVSLLVEGLVSGAPGARPSPSTVALLGRPAEPGLDAVVGHLDAATADPLENMLETIKGGAAWLFYPAMRDGPLRLVEDSNEEDEAEPGTGERVAALAALIRGDGVEPDTDPWNRRIRLKDFSLRWWHFQALKRARSVNAIGRPQPVGSRLLSAMAKVLGPDLFVLGPQSFAPADLAPRWVSVVGAPHVPTRLDTPGGLLSEWTRHEKWEQGLRLGAVPELADIATWLEEEGNLATVVEKISDRLEAHRWLPAYVADVTGETPGAGPVGTGWAAVVTVDKLVDLKRAPAERLAELVALVGVHETAELVVDVVASALGRDTAWATDLLYTWLWAPLDGPSVTPPGTVGPATPAMFDFTHPAITGVLDEPLLSMGGEALVEGAAAPGWAHRQLVRAWKLERLADALGWSHADTTRVHQGEAAGDVDTAWPWSRANHIIASAPGDSEPSAVRPLDEALAVQLSLARKHGAYMVRVAGVDREMTRSDPTVSALDLVARLLGERPAGESEGEFLAFKAVAARRIGRDSAAFVDALQGAPPSSWDPESPGNVDAAVLLIERMGFVDAVTQRFGVGLADLVSLRRPVMDANSVATFRNTLRQAYGDLGWVSAYTPVLDRMRELRRDALVAWLTWNREDVPTADAVGELLLCDPLVNSPVTTSRMVFAHTSIQRLVQRIQFKMELDGLRLTPAQLERWNWTKRYRLWEAAMRVFVYPENWIDPVLRTDASEAYRRAVTSMSGASFDIKAAESVFNEFVEWYAETGSLEIVAQEPVPVRAAPGSDPEYRWHVLARSRTDAPVYYHRVRQADGTWNPWERIDADVDGAAHVVCEFAGRVVIFWVSIADHEQDDPGRPLPVDLGMIERTAAGWTRGKTLVRSWFTTQSRGHEILLTVDREDGIARVRASDLSWTAGTEAPGGLGTVSTASPALFWDLDADGYRDADETLLDIDAKLVNELLANVRMGVPFDLALFLLLFLNRQTLPNPLDDLWDQFVRNDGFDPVIGYTFFLGVGAGATPSEDRYGLRGLWRLFKQVGQATIRDDDRTVAVIDPQADQLIKAFMPERYVIRGNQFESVVEEGHVPPLFVNLPGNTPQRQLLLRHEKSDPVRVVVASQGRQAGRFGHSFALQDDAHVYLVYPSGGHLTSSAPMPDE